LAWHTYSIQPAATRTIHHSQSLTFNYLAFDLNGVHHHGFTYTSLSSVRNKKYEILFAQLIDVNFKVDKCVSNEMQQLRTTIQWQLCISSLQPFRKTHTIIQSLNTRSLSLHFENIETNHNLQTYFTSIHKPSKIYIN
jgi:hypothetical protein